MFPRPSDPGIKGFDRFQIVIEDIGGGGENIPERLPVSAEIRNQDFDPDAGDFFSQSLERPDELFGAPVREIVPGHGRHDDIRQPEGRGGLRDFFWLIGRKGRRRAFLYGAKGAGSGADIAQDEKGRGFPAPAIGDIRTLRAPADRVQTARFQERCNGETISVRGEPDLKPGRFTDLPRFRGRWDDQYSRSFSLFIRRRIRLRAWASFIRFRSPGLK